MLKVVANVAISMPAEHFERIFRGFLEVPIYNSDKSILYKELDKLEDGEMLKAMTENEDERFHSGIPLPRHRSIEVTENEDGTKTYRVIE